MHRWGGNAGERAGDAERDGESKDGEMEVCLSIGSTWKLERKSFADVGWLRLLLKIAEELRTGVVLGGRGGSDAT